MGAYKMARHAFDKLQQLVIPRRFQEAVDLSSITIRSKPFQVSAYLLFPLRYHIYTLSVQQK